MTLNAIRRQRRAGYLLLVVFLLILAGLALQAPERSLIDKRVLKSVLRDEPVGFDATFGTFPALVKDNGGSPLLPGTISGEASGKTGTGSQAPEYRTLSWLRQQPAGEATLAVGDFATEGEALALITGRPDRDQYLFFRLSRPEGPRFVVVYGRFASDADAEEVLAALPELPGSPQVRTWGSFVAQLPDPAPAPVLP